MSEEFKRNLLNHFPVGKTPREKQIELLKKLQDALKSDKKHIMLCAPTGIGKSYISATLANSSDEACDGFRDYIESYRAFVDGNQEEAEEYKNCGSGVLTCTKQLQDQYTKDFSNLNLCKGKSNYICDFDNDFDVEDAPCNESSLLKRECWKCHRCFYYEDRNDAILSKFGVFNYNVFLSLPTHVRKKQLLICDEASELEETLIGIFSVEVKYSDIEKLLEYKFKKLDTDDDEIKGHDWLCDLYEALLEKQVYYEDILKNKKHKLYGKAKFRNKTLKRMVANIKQVFENWFPNGGDVNSTEYIVELQNPDKYNPNVEEGVLFTPLRANKISRYLFNSADKIIYLSATIIDHKKELEDLGVDKDDYVYIECGSIFDPKKSPIYTLGKYPLSYKNMQENLPKVIDYAGKILQKHSNDKGLVHTVNFKICKAMEEQLSNDSRLLFRGGHMTNGMILKEHLETDNPTVMISPSMSHGVDLKGDYGRFQIIMKVPYLPLGNKRIKILSKTDYRWYINATLKTLIQMCGRCTRSENDEAVTYILDGNIQNVLKQNMNKLPKHFKDRIK